MAWRVDAGVVKRGGRWARVYADGVERAIGPVEPDDVVDHTGCGDANRAGLLYGLEQKWNFADACRLANVMGAIKVASRGPQNHKPDRERISARLHEAYGLTL